MFYSRNAMICLTRLETYWMHFLIQIKNVYLLFVLLFSIHAFMHVIYFQPFYLIFLREYRVLSAVYMPLFH